MQLLFEIYHIKVHNIVIIVIFTIEIASKASVDEVRFELFELRVMFTTKESQLLEELRVKDVRLSSYTNKIQLNSDLKEYGKICRNNTIQITYAIIKLCFTSENIQIEDKNLNSYLSNFDRIFEYQNHITFREKILINKVYLDKKSCFKLLKLVKRVLDESKHENILTNKYTKISSIQRYNFKSNYISYLYTTDSSNDDDEFDMKSNNNKYNENINNNENI